MRKLIAPILFSAITLVAAVVLFSTLSNSSAQVTSAEREAEAAKLPALRAAIYGAPLSGEREIEPLTIGQTDAAAQAIFRSGYRPVRVGDQFQLTVTRGGITDVTSHPRIKYSAVGCLSVSAQGFVTVAQTDPQIPCNPGLLSTVSVAVGDGTKTLAWNRYFFVIQP